MELGAFSVSLSIKDIGMSFWWISAVFWPQMTHYQKRGKSTPPAECAARRQKTPALIGNWNGNDRTVHGEESIAAKELKEPSAAKPQPKERGIYSASASDHT